MKKIAVAIDGPSGAGKSTIARTVAQSLGFLYVDTGALYRTIGLSVLRHGFDGLQTQEIISVLPKTHISLRYLDGVQRVFLDDEDVSEQIRTPEISLYASRVSIVPEVRIFLLDMQREIASKHSVVMDGRDIGTVILPHAEVKIFLTASPEKRAQRRFSELQEKGIATDFAQVLEDMKERDAKDMGRNIAPLRQAKDAVLVDTSELTLEQSIAAVLEVIRSAQN